MWSRSVLELGAGRAAGAMASCPSSAPCPVCTCGSLRVQRHIRAAVFVWVPLAIRAQPCRPGLRMKISARFEWVQSFSYANGMH